MLERVAGALPLHALHDIRIRIKRSLNENYVRAYKCNGKILKRAP